MIIGCRSAPTNLLIGHWLPKSNNNFRACVDCLTVFTPFSHAIFEMASQEVQSVSESETPPREPETKKRKLCWKRVERFKTDYTTKWPCLVKGSKGEHFCLCKICDCEFTVAHGGRNDCFRHIESPKHKESAKAKSKNIRSFFVSNPKPSTSSTDSLRDVTRAEVKLVDLITEMNLPLSALDSFSKAVKSMFRDSEIAKQWMILFSLGFPPPPSFDNFNDCSW